MNGTHKTESLQSANPKNAIYVWDKFKSIFGIGFLASFGECPDLLWIESMSRLSEKDINMGLNKVLHGGYDFAPSLSKFLKLCEPETFEDVYKLERETLMLLEKRKNIRGSADVRESALAEMRKMLNN